MDGGLPPGEVSMATGQTFWLGTDQQGRDMLSGIMYGLRISLMVAVVSLTLAITIGTIVGVAAAYFGGRFDSLVMRIVDLQLSFPAILIALILLALLGRGRGQGDPGAGHRAMGLLRAHGAQLGHGGNPQGLHRRRPLPGPVATAGSCSATCCPTACRP